ncbi:anti-sigma factor [Aquipluma nitroreducens]|uniref:Anti-sigma factor n=1 Tax=Aquipluma nitroreducens TaxID=2010828 RepID=A0A5K7SDB1_9BACT|nr:FecR domain-containing protein [Aquipluma nitroreducens]BBE19591.1 anti-sigma factor [Aquipluma nitroreducens]
MTFSDQKFIEDPKFLQWIFHNNQLVNQYWEQYLLEHPEEEAQIIELKTRLSELKYSDETMLQFEKEQIAQQVISRINLDLEKNKRQSIFVSFLKYAAVAVAFAVIGGLAVYLNSDNNSIYQQLAGQMVQIPSEGQGPLLITSTGENVDLKKSNSSVDYTRNGAIVLNSDSVIKAADDMPNVMNQLVIPYGNQSKLILSDNTVVWLNAGSRLVYPTFFSGKTREVLLFGEAFFEVSKNADKPFIVKTSDIEIKVLGTQFNVSAYAEDKVIQTVLKEGSVAIRQNNASFFDKEVVLKPNQMASFAKNSNETKLTDVDVSYYTLWTKGLLSFDDVDFNRIVKKVERFYNISVNFSEPILGTIRISGKLDLKKNKDEVLEYLEKVSLTNIKKISENQYMVKK